MANSMTEEGLRHYCNEIKSHAIAGRERRKK